MTEPLEGKFTGTVSDIDGVDFGGTGDRREALRTIAGILEGDPEGSLAKVVEQALRKELHRRKVDAHHRRRFLASAARCDLLPPYDPNWGAGLKMQWFQAFNAILRGEDAEVPDELTAPPPVHLGPDEVTLRRYEVTNQIVEAQRKARAGA